ncbi:hypothetical protein V2W45_1350248 [Cenococcum geophilum]
MSNGSEFEQDKRRYFASVEVVDGSNGDFQKATEIVSRARKFFITEKGYFGVGPACMENDLVYILYGRRVPFLLRPKNNFYHLVGECYVHGIMDGEAITMLEARRLSEASFEVHGDLVSYCPAPGFSLPNRQKGKN